MLSIIYLVVLFVILFIFLRIINKKENDIPGPSLIQLITLVVRSKSYSDALEAVMNLNSTYGATINLSSWPMKPIIMTTNVGALEKILNSKDHLEKADFYDPFKVMLGYNGLAVMPAAPWKQNRKLMNAAMGQSFLNKFLMNTDSYISNIIGTIEKFLDKPIHLDPIVSNNLIDAIVTSLSDYPDLNLKFYRTFLSAKLTFLELATSKLTSIHMQSDFLHKFTDNYKKLLEVRKYFRNIARDILSRYKLDDTESGDAVDFIQFLINGGMSEEVLIDNIITVMEAGHDTTATTIMFGLYELSKHPEIQRRIYEEIKSEDNPDEDIAKGKRLSYLDCFIKETLRCNSVAAFIGRKTGVDVELDGYVVPKNSTILIPINAIHFSENNYRDANVFNPDRFLDDDINEFAYLPFSAGPRNCIGKTIALRQLKLAFSRLIRKFEILPHDYKIQMRYVPLRLSLNGIYVIFKRRQG